MRSEKTKLKSFGKKGKFYVNPVVYIEQSFNNWIDDTITAVFECDKIIKIPRILNRK